MDKKLEALEGQVKTMKMQLTIAVVAQEKLFSKSSRTKTDSSARKAVVEKLLSAQKVYFIAQTLMADNLVNEDSTAILPMLWIKNPLHFLHDQLAASRSHHQWWLLTL